MNSRCNNSSVSLGDLRLSYSTFGNGNMHIIAFHGHGRSSKDFEFLGNIGKVISIDLFFHGESYFPLTKIEKNPLKTSEFYLLFKEILKNEQVKSYHLIAFSQGGRFALSILPDELNHLLSIQLISPDGMDNKSFYNRMSRIKWARNLFIKWERNPKKVIRYAGIAEKLGLIRPKVHAFTKKFASEKQTFIRASQTWRGFRMIQADEGRLKTSLATYNGYFRIIMGKYDQVIRTKQATTFLARIDQRNTLVELACGHDFFNEENFPLLKDILKFN